MSKILAVIGATGQQGSGVVDYVAHDPELSKEWKVRAITRNVDSDKAKSLKAKVEVVQGDATERASLAKALQGVHTLFAMTTPVFGVDDPLEAEFQVIKGIADTAVEEGVQYFIFSTLPSIRDISNNKFTAVAPFDAKAKGEAYIKSLPFKSSFYCPGSFMENFATQPMLAPRPDPSQKDTWVFTRNMTPETTMPLIDITGDGGKFVGAILADPDKYEGKTICAATRLYTLSEMATALSKSTGKNVVFKQVSDDEFARSLPDMVATLFVHYFGYINDYGYYGPGTEEKVKWAAEQARGKLSTFEDYLEKHPYKLE
ncbi:hypothetical protein H2204_014001 [Knufia peltigerae]|uniref:NmrA-like domain-containing protein n=1 Tax=Knufia peltigerae TaxID=1002370 RepID=A0AA38XNC2_9EURO|nr:hypothetical protein H2204_014001 [Knufia peltigerae]